jgi:hypothetical protein
MKKLSVGVIGIPIQLEKKHSITKESFSPGLTDSLRLKTKQFIEKMSKEKNLEIDVLDLGELVDSEHVLSEKEKLIGIPKKRLDELAQRLKQRIKDMDLVIFYGGVHTAAYLLYHLPGRVERYDIHDDDYEVDMPFHTSYFKHAIELKKPSQISNHDLMDRILVDETEASGSIFDIDVDYLSPSVYCQLREEDVKNNFQKIKKDICKAKPKIIGFFEFQTLDGTSEGYKRLLSLVWEGIKAIRGITERSPLA